MNLVDSSGWLEYYSDGPNADFFAPAILDTEHLLVSTINIYEVFKKLLRERDMNAALEAVAGMRQGRVIPVDETIALEGVVVSTEFNLPMADALILATAHLHRAQVWTQDADFEGLENVRYRKVKDR